MSEYVKTGKASITYKYLPILDPTAADGESHWAAYAAECANRQGKFWEYHDKLFGEWRGENSGAFALANLKQYAAQIGLDTTKFDQCLDSGATKAVVQQDVAGATTSGVNSTPLFFLNGKPFYPTALDAASFTAALDRAIQ